MFDIGWSEMAIIMLLALIIIGPKDLPRVARTVGQWVRKGRMLAREFQTSLEDMAKEAELDDVKKEIEKVGRTDFKKAVENSIDPKGDLKKAFDTTDAGKGEDTVGKTLNGSTEAKTSAAEKTPELAKAEAPTQATAAMSPSKPAPKKPATRKKPATAAKKPAASTKKTTAPKVPAAKKPAAPKKRATKPASSAKSGTADTPSSDDGGSAAMAAKSS